MNKLTHHIIIIIAAIAVFFTGTGVTVMNYCCTGCVAEIFSDKQQSCCTSHDISEAQESGDSCTTHGNDTHSDICETAISASNDHCTSSRLSIDLDSSMYKPHVAIPFVWLSEIPQFIVNGLTDDAGYIDIIQHVDDPPSIPPRSYLSLIRVLII